MDTKEVIANIKPNSVLRYSNLDGKKMYFFISDVKDFEVYGTIVNPSGVQCNVSLESVLSLNDLEIVDSWKELK